jgi:hypothetical protein
MRSTGCLFVMVIVGLPYPAFGAQPGCASCNGGAANVWAMRGLGAEACASPCGHALVPGCCEDTRHCCDNAWAGYCDHRARVDAFWAKVGTPGACGHGCFSRPVRGASCDKCSSSGNGNASPTPAVKLLPAPPKPEPPVAPLPPTPSDKASRATSNSRLR